MCISKFVLFIYINIFNFLCKKNVYRRKWWILRKEMTRRNPPHFGCGSWLFLIWPNLISKIIGMMGMYNIFLSFMFKCKVVNGSSQKSLNYVNPIVLVQYLKYMNDIFVRVQTLEVYSTCKKKKSSIHISATCFYTN